MYVRLQITRTKPLSLWWVCLKYMLYICNQYSPEKFVWWDFILLFFFSFSCKCIYFYYKCDTDNKCENDLEICEVIFHNFKKKHSQRLRSQITRLKRKWHHTFMYLKNFNAQFNIYCGSSCCQYTVYRTYDVYNHVSVLSHLYVFISIIRLCTFIGLLNIS